MRCVIKKRAHSPGPWNWEQCGFGNDSWELLASDGAIVCDDGSSCGEYRSTINPNGGKTERANAALLAAAPELLDALRELTACCADLSHMYDPEIATARALVDRLDKGKEPKE